MTDEPLYVLDDGRYVATNGPRARVVDSVDAELEPGWHLMTIAELDAKADEIIEDALLEVRRDPSFQRKIARRARWN